MQNFYIFPRDVRGKRFFYCNIVDELTGKKSTAKSVDIIAKSIGISRHITKKTEAYEIVQKAIESGIVKDKVVEDISFIKYLNDFWDWDKSFYVRRENKKKANSIGKDYVYNCATCVRLHIKPYISDTLKCSQITKKHIQNLQEKVIDECSVSVWNNTLRALCKTEAYAIVCKSVYFNFNEVTGLFRFVSNFRMKPT